MRSILVAALAITPLATACGDSLYQLQVFYEDEVVEAPTRSITVRAIQGASSCSPALSRTFDEPGTDEDIVAEFENDYPVDPETTPLSALPLDQPLALEVAGFDGTRTLISRGCVTTRLTDEGPAVIPVELRALPKCDDVPWTSLDVTIALDTSLQAALSDSDKAHFAGIRDHLLKQPNLPGSTRFSIVSFGEDGMVREVLAPTDSSTLSIAALDSLYNVHSGPSNLFDGMVFATSKLRARAACGRYPVLLVVAANADEVSTAEFSDAAFGVFGAQGDLGDDIYLAGMPLAEPAFTILDAIVPEGSAKSYLARAGSPALIDFGFQQIRNQLIEFLSTPSEE